jgi:hypothetical protein
MDVNMQIALGSINLLLGAIIPPMGIKALIILVFFFHIANLEARPISYSGGYTLMMESNNMQDSVYYHYSPSYKYSLGIQQIKDKYFNSNYSYLRLTYLLNRRNTKNSQRNLYLQSGLSSDGLDHYFYGTHGDWETRRLYAGFGYKKTMMETLDYIEQYLQVGVAPYIGEYGDLHTWLMFKAKKNDLTSDWDTYPVLKFFKGNALVEFGYSDTSNWDIHLMYRF